ncbi:hypothetical protein GOB57_20970 [Sinorhizobium meliloti]|nr:hypothetical protein [Sinorhizobium meliloti]
MIFEHQFVNQIVGVASGFRDVALYHVMDRAVFELLDRDPADFPLATRDRSSVRSHGWQPDLTHTTRWQGDSHWKFVGYARDIKFDSDMSRLGTLRLAPFKMGPKQNAFEEGTKFREVVENKREEIIALIQEHLDRNVALVEDAIWRRSDEPCYNLKLIDGPAGRKVHGTLRSSLVSHHGFQGQRFRLDDQETFREAVLDFMDKGWTLHESNGITWGVPDMEVLVPESIALEPEAQTVVDLAFAFNNAPRTATKAMSYEELESYRRLKEAFQSTDPLSGAFDEDSISGLLDSIRLLARHRGSNEDLNEASIALATDRWENRAIGDFLAVRSCRPLF